MKKVVAIAVRHPQQPNLFLHGLRRDNHKWALAGGHAKPDESDDEAAERELKEETGLSGVKLDRMHAKAYGETHVHLFACDFPQGANLDAKKDPDKEFVTFKFLDPTSHENLHIPSERNILVDWMKNSLAKDQPVISFPKIPSMPTRLDQEMVAVPPGKKADARRTKAIALKSYLTKIKNATGLKMVSDKFASSAKRDIGKVGGVNAAGVMMNATQHGTPVRDAFKGLYSTAAGRSTQHHEAAHLLMAHVEQNFGTAAKNKVIDHVLAHFHPEDRNAMASSLTGLKSSYRKDPYFKEEMMNHFRDYLVDPTGRDKHEARALKRGYKFDQSRVKTAWKNAVAYLKNHADENWMRSPETDLNSIRMSASKLKPTEYSPATEKLAAAAGKMKVEPFTADPEVFNPRKHDFIVRAISRGKQVGILAVTHTKDGGLMPFNFEVNRLHRRKGYGTAMAAHAQKISGKKIVRSPDMTGDAVAFANKFIKPV